MSPRLWNGDIKEVMGFSIHLWEICEIGIVSPECWYHMRYIRWKVRKGIIATSHMMLWNIRNTEKKTDLQDIGWLVYALPFNVSVLQNTVFASFYALWISCVSETYLVLLTLINQYIVNVYYYLPFCMLMWVDSLNARFPLTLTIHQIKLFDHVMTWKHFPHILFFAAGILGSPVDFPYKVINANIFVHVTLMI